MLPKRGPSLYLVANLNGQIIAPAGGVLGPKSFLFPKSVFVTGLIAVATSGLQTDLAALQIRLLDEDQDDMFYDGLGAHECPMLQLLGSTVTGPIFVPLMHKRPYALQRPVRSLDEWMFTITNTHANREIALELGILFEEGERAA